MDKIIRPVWAEIDLDKIAFNMRNIKNVAGDREVIAVIKADAYGHGAVELAEVLLENGASRFAVAIITEAIELRESGIKAPIMILGYTPIEFGQDLIKYDIEQTVYDLEYAKQLSEIALKMGKKAKIHIALDTGMGRIGFMPNEESLNEVLEIASLDGIETVGIFTHFSTADEEDKEYTNYQFAKIQNFIKMLSNNGVNIPIKHVSNSGAIIDLPETYLDAVRAGIILYGYYPSNEVNKERLSIEPALTLKAKIGHVKKLEKGMYVSYGRTFKTERDSIIATLPIGYADGYSRLLSGKAKVIVNGKFANVIGRICMDQCMIDVTDVGEVKVGDEVIILGEDRDLKFNADDMAELIGTINYDILCMIKHRVPRIYKKNNEIIKVKNYF
ncbi:alanine racemase [Clostridium sardiniense]|uniref:Alanine racemase n=1 Tax=Clostridium sardiniense TaxID=29369 RepID=A0ABS7KUH1_CLOSR|nr:alanine racemase [Clostridium sardiniense]MBY0754233.1 alanine racemase [Clostridium sardiniense]MDQ0461210.1 alanine racemase [Clostridium sardiniense]